MSKEACPVQEKFKTMIGGQALIEGILMRGPKKQAIVCRTAEGLVEKVEDVVNIGDELEVKVNEIDAQGRINLIRNDIEYAAGSDAPRRDGNRRPPRRTSNHD